MNKKTKTWKIGEYSGHGIITATVKANGDILVELKEWDYYQGSMRGINQSKAKVGASLNIHEEHPQGYRCLLEFIQNDTTSYYADTILFWIKENSYLKER